VWQFIGGRMMVGFEITKHTLIKRESLNPYQYTLSLLKEGFKAGIIDKQALYGIQEQIMFILKDIIISYTKGESSSVKTETAEGFLNSIYYSIDAYVSSFEDPEAGIALLKSESIKGTYDAGVEIVASYYKEARQLCQEIVRNKLDVPLEVYNTSVTEALPEFFENYSVVFGAHDTACSLDYPLIFDDMNVRGVFYIKNYLENLDTETQFCKFYSKADIEKTLILYGRKNMIDYKESPVNLFEILISSSIFSALSGNNAGGLIISRSQFELLQRKLTGLDYIQTDFIISSVVEKLISDLNIGGTKLADYIRRYKKGFVQRIAIAAENNNLRNIVLISAKEEFLHGATAFVEKDRLCDDVYRLVISEIMKCTDVADKIRVIRLSIHSIEDFIDMLNADCLFGNEFEALFSALSDMELAVLGKMVFADELRDGTAHLSEMLVNKKDESVEWQSSYIRYMQGLNRAKIKSIAGLINEINSW
jgi:hypothetical protein